MTTISKRRQHNDFHKFLFSNMSVHNYDNLHIELGMSLKMLTNLINKPYRLNIAELYIISKFCNNKLEEIMQIIIIAIPDGFIKPRNPRKKCFLIPANKNN